MGHDRSAASRSRTALGAALAASALAVPAVASGAPAVLAPVDVSAAGASAGAPLAGMDSGGGVLVVWQTGEAVLAASRPPGGTLTPGARLSAPGDRVGSAALAVAPSGAAVSAWWRATPGGEVVQVSGREPGGAFAPPVDVSPPGAFAPRAAVASDGGAIVAWLRFDPISGSAVVEAVRRPPGGAFGAPEVISEPGANALAVQMAVDSAGRIVLAWNRSDGLHTRLQAAVGTLAAGVDAPVTLSAPGEDAYDPRVALTPAGGALVAWTRSDGVHTRVQLVELVGGAPAGEPATLSAPGADASDPRLAVDRAGEAVVAWRRSARGGERIQAAIRPPGGPVAAVADLSTPGVAAAEPDVAVDAAGRAVVTWRRADALDPRVRIASRDPGRAFAPAVDVSTRGVVVNAPAVALDGAGNGVVVWRRVAGADDVVQMAGLDDAPPVFRDVSAPATAVVGVPVRMAVQADDVWSALAPGPTWSFAPGSGAVGPAVVHAFPAAGPYTVRVVQADAVGRVAVLERRIEVSAQAASIARAAPPPATAASHTARRPVNLRVGWGWARDRSRVWLRVRGRTSPLLRGRTVLVERRVGRRSVALCRVPVRARGGFDGRCRVDRFARGGRITLRVRARVTASRATRARTLPFVIRRAAGPVSRAVRR